MCLRAGGIPDQQTKLSASAMSGTRSSTANVRLRIITRLRMRGSSFFFAHAVVVYSQTKRSLDPAMWRVDG